MFPLLMKLAKKVMGKAIVVWEATFLVKEDKVSYPAIMVYSVDSPVLSSRLDRPEDEDMWEYQGGDGSELWPVKLLVSTEHDSAKLIFNYYDDLYSFEYYGL